MLKFKAFLPSLLMLIMFSSTIVITGCSSGPDDEQIQQLNDLKAEVESLQSQVNAKMDEKSQLQKQIADKDAKIKQYQNDMDAVRKRCP